MSYFMVLELCQTYSSGLIDSFPYPLCQPIRNLRATLLSDVANIGYNATKKIHYYRVKFSVLVNDNGFPIDYVVTPTSVYNGDVTLELLENSPFPIVYGNKGYMDRQTKENLICYDFFNFYPLDQIDMIITDNKITSKQLQEFGQNTNIIQAD